MNEPPEKPPTQDSPPSMAAMEPVLFGGLVGAVIGVTWMQFVEWDDLLESIISLSFAALGLVIAKQRQKRRQR